MNILLVANHFSVCSARYVADAFARLGHNVRHVGAAMGNRIWGMTVPQEYVWTPDFDHLASEYWWETVDGKLDAFAPNLVVVMDSDPQVLDAIGKIRDWGVPVTVWGVDNHVRDYSRPYFDHYFLAHRSVSLMPWTPNLATMRPGDSVKVREDGSNPDMTWLPCAYDPHWFTPSPIPWAARAYDVVMIGVMYERRRQLAQAMRAAGLKVLAGTGLVYDAYRNAHWNSRVALVSSVCGDLPIRLFEGAAMGCAVLSDETPDLFALNRPIPVHIYKDVGRAVAEAQALQQLPEIAQQCVDWAQEHTWDRRAEKVIAWLEERQ